jgi:hypothetical protein
MVKRKASRTKKGRNYTSQNKIKIQQEKEEKCLLLNVTQKLKDR